METFWNGKNEAAIDKLNEMIPHYGSIQDKKKNKALEDWRVMQNIYYEVYNNGGINWSMNNYTYWMKKFIKLYLPEANCKHWEKDHICSTYGQRMMEYQFRNLEILADAVFKAVCKEQNITT